MDITIEFCVFSYVLNHVSKLIFDIFFLEISFLTFKQLKTIQFSGVDALGLWSNDFAKWQASDFISQTQNRYQKVS